MSISNKRPLGEMGLFELDDLVINALIGNFVPVADLHGEIVRRRSSLVLPDQKEHATRMDSDLNLLVNEIPDNPGEHNGE